MPHYHLFYVGPENGHAIETAVFDAPDEVAALARIAEGAFEHPLELWSGPNLVKRFGSMDVPIS
jgi:hypothetical protein